MHYIGCRPIGRVTKKLDFSLPNGRDILSIEGEIVAHRTITDEELLDRALELFRLHGFEGVSLSRLSEAIGLQKASLYHRYPGGKGQIVLAAVARVAQWFGEHVFALLKTR